MDADIGIAVNKLYEQYKTEDSQWKGVAEYFSQEEIQELKEKDKQNTELRFKQVAVQHYAMNKLRETLESYISKACIFQDMLDMLEDDFRDKYSKKIIEISEDLANSGIKLSPNQQREFLVNQIESVQNTLKQNDELYAHKEIELKPTKYHSTTLN